ncbi:MAG: hypothetical protein K0R93_685 [Anaerosolibacter sp.]|jgi:hypothetical protein|uniref:hypothetical protein n=1 Tax=Anaerosolibacter sp. TaxID=1872527 RepID=UPI00260D69B8|nr:hypothetical protein [Anaerosolibacter sp.]MDF2545787.1 hypothetical protein [Anaerosolibacter sp.]
MNILESTILSGLAWDGIKKFGNLTGAYIKKGLSEWILDEKSYKIIADKVNNMPKEYKKSQKFLEAAIDDDDELQDILKSARQALTFVQSDIGNNISRSNVINGMNNTINNTVNNYNSNTKKEADVRIIDIVIDSDSDERYPVLDVKLRNAGDEVAFLKKVSFNISDYFEMINPQITHFERIEATHTYDILLSGLDNKVYSLSQSILPNGVDRFRIRLANTFGDPIMPAIYKFSISILYNENNLCVKSEDMIIPIPSTEACNGYYVSDLSRENAKINYQNLKRFNRDTSLKSEHFQDIFDSYQKNESDFL